MHRRSHGGGGEGTTVTCPNPASEWIGAAGGRKRPRTGARRRGGARQPWRSCLSKRLPRRSRSYRSDGSSGSSRRRREEAGLLPNPLLPPSSLPALLSPSRCLLLLFQVRRLRRQGVPSSSTTTTTTGTSWFPSLSNCIFREKTAARAVESMFDGADWPMWYG